MVHVRTASERLTHMYYVTDHQRPLHTVAPLTSRGTQHLCVYNFLVYVPPPLSKERYDIL